MKLAEELIVAQRSISAGHEQESWSGVKIDCPEDLREMIASRFAEVFGQCYEDILNYVEQNYNGCYEKDEEINPFHGAIMTEYGLFLSFGNFAVHDSSGDYLIDDAGFAMEKSLKAIKQEYPSINYEGYICYFSSDTRSGDAVQYRVSSERKNDDNDHVYDFIGKKLGLALQEDEYWEDLADQLYDEPEKPFQAILKSFQFYSEWVPSDSMDRLIGLADESMRSSLKVFAAALRAGKDVVTEEKEEFNTHSLPEGYAEVFDLVRMAYEDREEYPKSGEHVYVNDLLPSVVAKAESGDAEAKCTAGKYILTNHIEEETERAILWIREAAREGLEEAKEYIKEHTELFH